MGAFRSPVAHGPAVSRSGIGRWGGSESDSSTRPQLVKNVRSAPLRGIYAEAAVGELLVLEGACGYLELAVRDGDAARTLGLAAGSPVCFRSAR